LQEYRDVLEKEQKILADQSKEYYSRVENFAYISLGILVAALSAIIGSSSGCLDRRAQKLSASLRQNYKAQSPSPGSSWNDSSGKRSRLFNFEYQRLKEHLESINSFGKREVVWLLRENMAKPEGEIAALHSVGLTCVTTSAPKVDSKDEIKEALKNADLAIITFDGSPETKSLLGHASTAIKFRQPPISLLIYTYGHYLNDRPVQLGPNDLEQLKDLSSFAPANFPATLVSQAQSLIIRNRSML